MSKAPKVRLAKPKGRPIQLRYTDRDTGQEVRITTGTHVEAEALEEKKTLEAKLLLGIDAKPRKRQIGGPTMAWDDFRQQYSKLQLISLRKGSHEAAEVRLDVAVCISKPKTLADLAVSEALHDLQARLLGGEQSMVGPKGKKRACGHVHPRQSKAT